MCTYTNNDGEYCTFGACNRHVGYKMLLLCFDKPLKCFASLWQMNGLEKLSCRPVVGAHRDWSDTCKNDHRWEYGAPSECSAPCGGGTFTRPVHCVDGNGVPGNHANCHGWSKPPVLVEEVGFSPSFVRSKTIKRNGCVFSSSLGCALLRFFFYLLTTISCNYYTPTLLHAQCAPLACTYRVEKGPWSVCSADCAGGQRTRVVTCVMDLGAS